MALPSSGQLSISMINTELLRSSTQSNSSLSALALLARTNSIPYINRNIPKISHWYGYQYVATVSYGHSFNYASFTNSSTLSCSTSTYNMVTVYSANQVLVVGSILFTDSNLTTPLNYFRGYLQYIIASSGLYGYAELKIGGEINSIGNCSIPDTTPPTNPGTLYNSSYPYVVGLIWAGSTDANTITYQIFRDDVYYASTNYEFYDDYTYDTVTRSYKVRAVDNSNNYSTFTNIVYAAAADNGEPT